MPIIYLVGPRASGKTTIGALLAYHLDYPFHDLDQCLQHAHQKTIAQIVSESGWERFRALESEILRTTATGCRGPAVIATGGGIILNAKNREFMAQTGKIVRIKTPEDELIRRLSKSPELSQRPSLTGSDIREEVRQVLAEREPLYRECAHHTVNGCDSPKQICDQIATLLGLSS